jgi:hypothetical protein
MAFDKVAYKDGLAKKIQERYTLREVGPADISQGDLGLGDAGQPQAPNAAPQAPQAPQTPQGPNGKAKDPEISMEVLKGTIQWALGEKESGKSSEEVINQVGAMKKPGLINFIHSYLSGSGQQAPAASPEAAQASGEPGSDDLSGLTAPEAAPAAPAPDPAAAPAPDAGADPNADSVL